MDAAPTGPPSATLPTIRTQTKRQRKAIVDLAKKGLNSVQIAKATGLHSSTIRRFLEKIQPESQAVTEFRSGRAEVLATLQAKNLTIQEKLLERLEDDGLLATLTPGQISGLMFALNTQHGTLYDKERLETGQSTQNHSIVARMLSSAVSDIYKPLKSKGTESTAPQSGAGSQEADGGSTTYGETQQEHVPCQDSEAGDPGGRGGE